MSTWKLEEGFVLSWTSNPLATGYETMKLPAILDKRILINIRFPATIDISHYNIVIHRFYHGWCRLLERNYFGTYCLFWAHFFDQTSFLIRTDVVKKGRALGSSSHISSVKPKKRKKHISPVNSRFGCCLPGIPQSSRVTQDRILYPSNCIPTPAVCTLCIFQWHIWNRHHFVKQLSGK